MSILNDVISDALRPLPNAPVLRRSAAESGGDWDDFSPEQPDAPSPGALTVYRLQMDGAATSSLLAPPIPRPTHASAPSERSLPTAAVLQHDALLPLVNRVNGLETGQESPSVRLSDAKESFEKNFVANHVSRPDGLESIAREGLSSLKPNVDENSSASIYRDDGNDERRQETGKATPSGDILEIPAPGRTNESGASPAFAFEGVDATDRVGAGHARDEPPALSDGSPAALSQHTSRPWAAPTGLVIEPSNSQAGEEPTQAERPSTPSSILRAPSSPAVASRTEDAGPKLSIGRIDVVVLAQPPAAKPAQESTDSAFLSKHYLRRI